MPRSTDVLPIRPANVHGPELPNQVATTLCKRHWPCGEGASKRPWGSRFGNSGSLGPNQEPDGGARGKRRDEDGNRWRLDSRAQKRGENLSSIVSFNPIPFMLRERVSLPLKSSSHWLEVGGEISPSLVAGGIKEPHFTRMSIPLLWDSFEVHLKTCSNRDQERRGNFTISPSFGKSQPREMEWKLFF